MALAIRSLKELKSGVTLEVSLAASSNSRMRKHVVNNGLLSKMAASCAVMGPPVEQQYVQKAI